MELYPLTFHTIFKDKIWGGQKIKTELGIDFGDLENCGEMWAISGVEGSPTLIENGFDVSSFANKNVDARYKTISASL